MSNLQNEIEKLINVKFKEIGRTISIELLNKKKIGNIPIFQSMRKLTDDEISTLEKNYFRFGQWLTKSEYDEKTQKFKNVYIKGWSSILSHEDFFPNYPLKPSKAKITFDKENRRYQKTGKREASHY